MLSSSYIVSSCLFCTDCYHAVSGTSTTQCFPMRSRRIPCAHTKWPCMQTKADLIGSYFGKASGSGSAPSTQTCMHVYMFSKQNEVPVRASMLHTGGGKLTPTPLVGPTTLLILATLLIIVMHSIYTYKWYKSLVFAFELLHCKFQLLHILLI